METVRSPLQGITASLPIYYLKEEDAFRHKARYINTVSISIFEFKSNRYLRLCMINVEPRSKYKRTMGAISLPLFAFSPFIGYWTSSTVPGPGMIYCGSQKVLPKGPQTSYKNAINSRPRYPFKPKIASIYFGGCDTNQPRKVRAESASGSPHYQTV